VTISVQTFCPRLALIEVSGAHSRARWTAEGRLLFGAHFCTNSSCVIATVTFVRKRTEFGALSCHACSGKRRQGLFEAAEKSVAFHRAEIARLTAKLGVTPARSRDAGLIRTTLKLH